MMLFREVARHDCAGNCEFDIVATFAGGEWQFVADHRAAIDALRTWAFAGAATLATPAAIRQIYPVRMQRPYFSTIGAC